jgi:hypothetical protein
VHRMIDVPLENGSSVLMEVTLDEAEQDGVIPAARADGVVAGAEVSFEQALDRVTPATVAIVKRLRDLAAKPDEVNVTFGLKMSAKAGAFIAASAIEANFTVELRWTRA